MSRADMEKRRKEETGTRDGDRTTGRSSSGLSIVLMLVAGLVAIGGLSDLLGGLGLLASPLFLFGIVLATVGIVKLWVAVGLLQRRARALGLAILLHVFGAIVALVNWAFATDLAGLFAPLLDVVLNVAIVGYLLYAADRFE